MQEYLKEAYVYLATTATVDIKKSNSPYAVSAMRMPHRAGIYIKKYGLCVKVGTTINSPAQRAYSNFLEKGIKTIRTNSLLTTQAGLLLIESLLRQFIENLPYTKQIGTDTFQIENEEQREEIISRWDEWLAIAENIANKMATV